MIIVLSISGCALRPIAPTRDDHGSAQDQRQRIVEMIQLGQLGEPDEYDEVALPQPLAGASNRGRVLVRNGPFMVFFVTWTGFSPDPYCGYEFAPDPGSVDPDPLGSGQGQAESIGDSWFWICAR